MTDENAWRFRVFGAAVISLVFGIFVGFWIGTIAGERTGADAACNFFCGVSGDGRGRSEGEDIRLDPGCVCTREEKIRWP